MNRDSISCPQFQIIGYADHKLVTCKVDLDSIFSQGSGYWKLNKLFPVGRAYRDWIKELDQKDLMGIIISNTWWYNLKRAIKVESLRFSKLLAVERNRLVGDLATKLEEAIRNHIANGVQVARLVLNEHFNTNHEGRIVKAKVHVLSKWKPMFLAGLE